MSNVDYWKKVCDEYEVVLKMKNEKLKELNEKLFYYEFTDNLDLVIDLVDEIKNKDNNLIKILLKNGKEILITPKKSKVVDTDDYLTIIENSKHTKIIYKIITNEIIGIKLYQ